VCGGKKLVQIVIRSISGRNRLVVGNIIPTIPEWRDEARVDPEGVASKTVDVLQLGNDAIDISDAVPIRVTERLGIDFVEDGITHPGRHGTLSAAAARMR
jgi:hypothetical protein